MSLATRALRRRHAYHSIVHRQYSAEPNINVLGIQQLDEDLRSRVFSAPSTPPSDDRVQLARRHLAYHDLLGRSTSIAPPVKFPGLPRLQGHSLDEHFYKLGSNMAQPYSDLASAFVAAGSGIPPRPTKDQWVQRAGWVKYELGKKPVPVDEPREQCLVFDTEVLYRESDFAVMATAVSPTAWYAWLSPWVLGQTDNPRQLIPLGNRDMTSVVVGHNVGYDRKRVQDEYHIAPSKAFYLDTMSLHVAIKGMCSRQRPDWIKMKKQKTSSTDADQSTAEPIHPTADSAALLLPGPVPPSADDDPWFNVSSLNNLADVAYLHCGIRMDKSRRDLFGELTREQVTDQFSDLLDYCATDVEVTYKVLQQVLPAFFEVCPHPVTFAALRNLSSVFLPINDKWESYVATAEKLYQEANTEIHDRLQYLANSVLELRDQPDAVRDDPWLSQLDWSVKPVRMVKSKDPSQPDRPRKNLKLPGMPEWYRSLFATAKSAMAVSARSRITPVLLRLSWDGRPLIWSEVHGWVFKAPLIDESHYVDKNYTKCVMDREPNEDLRGDLYHSYFKVPHKDGPSARCTVPMAKSYVSHFESGTLGSEYDYAKRAIELNTQCAYWVAARERVMSQMPVYSDDADMGLGGGSNGTKVGMILPKIIPMGTVTRRAVEDTWLTASNAKANRIGSEQKAMIQAPPGYSFVGADVDSEELWIASLIGDALFGIHGGTALGWMTLEGSKKEKTDLHSKTASILGISRNNAKVFNYGRIYGAGVKFAAQLLKQFNPLISETQAREAAKKLYAATKGSKTKLKGFSVDSFWRGGTESIIFNRLEEMADQDVPRTPVLGCAITEALMRKNLRKSTFLPSRVNWTIQSSGVDYLHLLIVSMNYLIERYNINARLSITVHDEIRYLVSDSDRYRCALALQVANLWTRAMFCEQLGLDNVPQSCAFFSLIDIDRVIRKEVDLDCVTPSHPEAIPAGEALDIYTLLEKVPNLGPGDLAKDAEYDEIPYSPRVSVVNDMLREKYSLDYLMAQVAIEERDAKNIALSVQRRKYKDARASRPKRARAKKDKKESAPFPELDAELETELDSSLLQVPPEVQAFVSHQGLNEAERHFQ